MSSDNLTNINTKLIVLTGGPGAGKTATLEMMRRLLDQDIAFLPEAASIIFGGGFLRLNSHHAITCEQRAIYHVQNELQKLVIGEKKWRAGICDRGTLDSLAFWPESEETFFEQLGTTKQIEYTKFEAVIHMRSPTLKQGYNHQNPLRIESPDEARKIDSRIQQIWRNHPNYYVVDSEDNFMAKIQKVTELVRSHLKNLNTNF